MRRRIGWIAGAALMLSSLGTAQTAAVDHLTQAQLLEKVKELKKQAAAANGSASVKLMEYPNHYTMLSYRAASGGGEVHEHFADMFYVISGTATLITGGSLVASTTVSPGELRGSAVTGDSKTELHAGDIVHISARVPHQLILAGGQEFVYFVVKVQEQ
jgi:mannose-6-phosphate isomerase-like protein (cupin superfamily)